jgi:hypothetical protein
VTIGGGVGVWVWFHASRGDRLAVEGIIVGAGTFMLALWAAIIAAIAFMQSDRRPRLRPLVRLLFDAPSSGPFGERAPQHVIYTLPNAPGGPSDRWPDGAPLSKGLVQVLLENVGEATARNVTVVVTIHNLQVFEVVLNGWTALDRDPVSGRTRLQWDGGVDQTVHLEQSRSLPDVTLLTCYAIPDTYVAITAMVVADQVRPTHSGHNFQIQRPPS